MPPDESADCVQLLRFGATAVSQHQQVLPELAGLVIALHVYVRRFGAVDARETYLTPALRMRATPRYHRIVDQFAFDFAPARPHTFPKTAGGPPPLIAYFPLYGPSRILP